MIWWWYIQVFTLVVTNLLWDPVCGQPCSWLVDVTTFEEPFRQTTFIRDDKQLVSLKDFLENQFEAKNMQPSIQELYKAYPYYIRVQVLCGQNISVSEARTLVQQGLIPKVTISYDSNHIDGHQSSVLNNIEYGALIDLDCFEFGECGFDICRPSWIVPLPFLYHTTKMQVKVDLPGYNAITPKSLVVYINGYSPNNEGSLIHFCHDNATEDLLQQIKTRQAHYSIQTVTLSTASLLIGGFESTNQIILTEDAFQTLSTIEIQLELEDFVCPGNSSHIKGAATIPDRLIFNTAAGIVEIFGSYEAMKATELPTSELNQPARCYSRMVVVEYAFNSVKHVLAISEENHVYDSPITFGEALHFARVNDSHGQDPCQHYGGSDCLVISVGLSGIEDNLYLFLIQSSSNYSLIQMKDSIMTTIPISEKIAESHDSTNLYLCELSLTTYQSTHMFIWGSVILHSNDLGRTIRQLNQYTSISNITLFVSSPNTPHFAILNQLNEVWYGLIGDNVSLMKLKPSSGWSLVHSLANNYHSKELWDVSSTVSIFYDSETVLHELVLFENNGVLYLESHVIPIGRILQHHEFLENLQLFPVDRSKPTPIVYQSRCPFTELSFVYHNRAKYERLEWFQFNAPHLAWQSQIHTADSVKVYQGIVQQMTLQNEQNLLQPYSHTDPFAKWLSRRQDNTLYNDYMFRNKLLTYGVHVSPTEYKKLYDQDDIMSDQLPRRIFLDLFDSYTFSLVLAIDKSELTVFRNLENLRVSVSLSNYSLVHVHTDRQTSYVNNTVTYEITLMDQGQIQHQEAPGQHHHPVTMLLQVWNSNFKCVNPYTVDNDAPQGTYSMSVKLGCPPALKLVFDMASTLEQLVTMHQKPYDCAHPQPDMHCFYYDHPFHPVFKLVDLATGNSTNFTSDYTLTVIGGSETSIDDIKMFSTQDILRHNSQENAGSLIWIPLDEESRGDGSIPIFSHLHNGIVWRCQDESPCSNVPVQFPFSPEYYFLIEVSNWDVGKETTNCGYKIQFIIKVHGLQISFYRSLRIMGFTFLVLILTCGLYLWCKEDDWKNWKCISNVIFSKNVVIPVVEESSSSILHVDDSSQESDAESSSSEHLMEVVEGNPEILKMITPSGVIHFSTIEEEDTTTSETTQNHQQVLSILHE
ncbi:cation channel sperm-associated protein subunit gamma 1-like [Antedon mediterranea]|uniref:cation channel sperm-associated protein subunit gamma 1-like n=1 Tax=Antedon mediterranea TaxID=105859 RepID=UPI003AF47837